MFEMIIEKQLNSIKDRTLILGIPNNDLIPKYVNIENAFYKVIGISCGVKEPYISIEIEKTNEYLVGKKALYN